MERSHAMSDLEGENSDASQEISDYDEVKADFNLHFGYSPTILREILGI